MTMTEPKSNFRLTKNTPYLALTGELWGAYCEDFGENVISDADIVVWTWQLFLAES